MESMNEKIFKTDGIYQLVEDDILNFSDLYTEFSEEVNKFGHIWYGTIALVIGGATVIEIMPSEDVALRREQSDDLQSLKVKGQILVGWDGAFGYNYDDLIEVTEISIDVSIPKHLDRNTPIATTAFGTWRVTGVGILYHPQVPRERKLFV